MGRTGPGERPGGRQPGARVDRALLIGVWEYADPGPAHDGDGDGDDGLGNIKAVRHNLRALARALKAGGALGVEVCRNPGVDRFNAALRQARAAADGVLLVYFAGHGVLAHGGPDRLRLGLRGSRVESGPVPSYQGWADWQELLPLLAQSPARHVVVILDCCYSGNAAAAFDQLPDELRRKTSLLWSVQRGQRTDAGDGRAPTPYTARLARLLREEPGGTLGGLARALARHMEDRYTTLDPQVRWTPGHRIAPAHEDLPLARRGARTPAPMGGAGPGPSFGSSTEVPDQEGQLGRTDAGDAPRRTPVREPRRRRLRRALSAPRLRRALPSLRLPGSPRRKAALLAGAGALLLGGAVTAALLLTGGDARAACGPPRELRLLTDPELESTVRAAADRYLKSGENRGEDGCRRSGITVYSAGAEDTVAAFRDHYEEWKQPPVQGGSDRRNPVGDVGPQPDIWIPASATSADRARKPDGQPAFLRFDDPVPLASSRLVLAVPGQAAPRAAGGPDGRRLHELIDELRERDPRAEVHRADPEFTDSALLATVGLYQGKGDDPREAESRVAQPGVRSPTGERLLCDLAEDGAQDRRATVLVPEFVLRTTSDCRWGAGTRRTVVRPEGLPVLDPAFVRVRWDAAELDEQARDDAVGTFLKWLRSKDGGREVFAAHGLGAPARPDATRGPPAAEVSAALETYRTVNGAGRVLFLLDNSGSMADLWEGTGGAPNVLAQSLDGLGADDEYAVWTVASPGGGAPAHKALFSFRPYGKGERDRQVRGAGVARGWEADPGAALRAALDATAARGAEEPRPELVVLLTDDEDNSRMSEGEQDGLVARVRDGKVPVVIASFDSGGCTEGSLDDRLALAGGGRCLSPANTDGDLTAALRDEVARVGTGDRE